MKKIIIMLLISSIVVFGTKNKESNIKAYASSSEGKDLLPEKAIDGEMGTRWSSKFDDPQWFMVDIGEKKTISKIILHWEAAFGKAYKIEISEDKETWHEILDTNTGNGNEDKITFKPQIARYVKLTGTKRALDWAGYSLYEFEIYDENNSRIVPPPPPPEYGLLKNFSFEKQLESWQKNGNASEIKVFNWHHIDGKMSCGIGNDKGPDNAYGEIFQEINVQGKINKGDLCIFKMRFKSENHYSGQASIKIEFHNEQKLISSKQSKILSKQFEWQELIVSAEAPANTKKIIVKCISEKMKSGKGGSFLWIDFGNVVCPIITASSYKKDNLPKNVMKDGMWQSNSDDKQWIEIDFRDMIEFSGISIDWTDDYASEYNVLISEDGNDWKTIYNVRKSSNEQDKIYLNHTVTRYIKINCNKSSTDNGYGIKEIAIMEKNSIITLEKYYNILAEQNPGFYPRWLIKKQAYWTGTGAESDKNEAIICEDGTIEPHKRGFSLIPFLYFDNKVITRDDVKIKQTLVNEYLPIPQVTWDYDNIQMDIKLFTHGKIDQSIAYIMYKITNTRKETINGKLFLSIRPFQIFPPWQRGGGFTYLDKIDYADNIITLNNKFTDFFKRPPFDHTIKIYPLVKPDNFGAIASSKSFKLPIKTPSESFEGNVMYYIQKGIVPSEKSVYDSEGLAEGSFYYNLILDPGQSTEFFVAVPLHDKYPSVNINIPLDKIKEEINKMLQHEIDFWTSRVDRFTVDIPEMDLVKMLKSNIAFNLITKDGHAFQPGARSYDKAWIRDGGMAAAAMLKMGLTEEVRGFIDWYTTFQEDSGLIPPIIDNKADDPLWELKPPHNLIEYDCQGEYIFTVMQYYNFTKDKEFLQGKLDNVKRACDYMVFLRNQTKLDEFKNGDSDVQKYYGILPRSTSHEGYWREYSYWDDFWGLKGWKDARKMFEILGKDDLAKWAQEEYADFKKCFYDSMRKTIEFYNIDYIPASASLGDYDPTSTAVAIMYCDEIHNLLEKELKYTFDRYYEELAKRFKPNAEYRFTPYELRNTPVFSYMGQKDRALDLLRFMLKCRRPLEWNQLAEVVNSKYRYPGYFGDMPHTWIGAEYINAVRCLFVYEEEDDLVIAAGIDEKWLDRDEGISVKDLPTYYGKISYTIKKSGDDIIVNITGDANHKKGFIFKSPYMNKKIEAVTINGKNWTDFSDDEIIIKKLPVDIKIMY